MKTIGGLNSENMFFLTRDGDIEITTVGFPKRENGGLYDYARQVIDVRSQEEFDVFGRNLIDRQFIRLCLLVFGYLANKENAFHSLSCKKVDDVYAVVLTLNVEINGRKMLQETEAELSNMVLLVEEWLAKECKPA